MVIALSAENNANFPDDFSGTSLHDFSHASEGYVLLGSNPSTATPESGDAVLLTTVTLQAVGGDSCTLGLTVTTLKDSDKADITVDSVNNGTFTVGGAAVAPTLVSYTISNTTITPPQTTSIDVRFSEQVSAIIRIEDASGNLVNELYSNTVTDPSAKIWDGTNTSGTTVPDGTYTVNVSGVNTTTGLSVIDTSKTITVGEVEVTTVSIGSATGANDSTVMVQISLTNAENITGASPTITYDPSVVQVQSMTANTSCAMTLQAVNIDNTAGKAIMSLTALSPGITVTDPTPIADVTFHLIGGDDTSTDLEFVDTADMLSDKDFNSFAPTTIENGSIVISMKGDFNGNGKIDIGDVAKIANLQVGNIPTTPGDLVKGDFNGNGKIDIGDVAKLANYQVGNIDEL